MLTPADKKYLKDAFITKGDLETFATKKDLSSLRDSIDLLRNKLTTSSLEKFDFKMRVDSLEASSIRTEEKADKILNILDGFAGRVADLNQENKMGAVTLNC